MKPLVSILLAFTLSGCAMGSLFLSYPAQLAQVKQGLTGPTPLASLPTLTQNIEGRDGLLFAQEAGRVAQIGGDFPASQSYYQAAIAAYDKFDKQATISATEIGANAGSLVLNDNIIPYRGAGYERVMVHQYQALNYLMQKKFEAALVEVRRANELQDLEQKRYEKTKDSVKAMANGTVDAEVTRLGQEAGPVTSSFMNAYSYYTTGLLHELLGEEDDAFIDYRKAAQIAPGNPFLEQDLVRLSKKLGMPQYDEFKQRFGAAKAPKADEGELVLILERGFVPEKRALTVPFKLHDNWQTVSLPTYMGANAPVSIASIGGLKAPLTAAPIANIGALAITSLKEDLPILLARQAARAYTKSELARSVDGNGTGGNVASIAIQVFNVVSEQADLRSWLTLPRQAQIARQYLPAGSYQLAIDGKTDSIQVQAGSTTLVWAIDTGSNIRFYSINIKR